MDRKRIPLFARWLVGSFLIAGSWGASAQQPAPIENKGVTPKQLLAVDLGPDATSVEYDNERSDLIEISAAAVAIPPEIPLEKDVTMWSDFGNRKATLVRSDATKITYDKEIGSITIESRDRPKQYIRLREFRMVKIEWINDRLLYIFCDIGHLAGVDAIFDAQTGKWIYRQTMWYGND